MFGLGKKQSDDSATTPAPVEEAPCAWCEAESGIRTYGSHGICDYHAAQQIAQMKADQEALKALKAGRK